MRRIRTFVWIVPAILAPDLAAQCTAHWTDSFNESGGQLGDDVFALASGVTASGAPALYVGGFFEESTPSFANHIAMWDGNSWSKLGAGLDGDVRALSVFDADGSGSNPPILYAGGAFTTAGGQAADRVAMWDGTSWSPMSTGMNGAGVRALAVFDDDGAGPNPPALHAAGSFTIAGGVPANRIAKWDGSSWSPLGSGTNDGIYALAVFDDDGAGPNAPALYAGGMFSEAGGVPAGGIAKWDGTSWSAVGGGVNEFVRALAVFDDDGAGPTPPALYAGGTFTAAGGAGAIFVARWNGTSWSPLGHGVSGGTVYALASFDDDDTGPNEPRLYVGGTFHTAGGVASPRVAAWDGTSWSPCGSGVALQTFNHLSVVMSLSVFDDDGAGPGLPVLYVGGNFDIAGDLQPVDTLVRWNGSSWSELVTNWGADDSVRALASYDADGTGGAPPALAVGGEFVTVAGLSVNGVAAWNGSSWSSLGTGVFGGVDGVNALIAFDDDAGGPNASRLFAGGGFVGAGSVLARGVAKWNGAVWTPVGSGFWRDFNAPATVHTLTVFDSDGAGPSLPELYAGGAFTETASGWLGGLARWNGSVWLDVGGGVFPAAAGSVRALTVFDEDGTGPGAPALFVGGSFTGVQGGSVPAENIARWSGTAWSVLGSGMDARVDALVAFDDDGAGPLPPALYAAGLFTTAGGTSANGIARWDGAVWSALGSGMNGGVSTLAVYDDDGVGPNPPALFAGGVFTLAGGVAANRIAKWDGVTWSGVDGGVDGGSSPSVSALAVVDFDAAGPSASTLFVGGAFASAGLESSGNLASWTGCGSNVATFCSGDGSLPTPCPCVPPNTVPNPPAAPGHGCANSLNPNGARLSVAGAVVPDTVRLTVAVAPSYGAFAFLLKGNASASDGIAAADGIRCVDGQLIRFGGHFAGTNGDPIGTWSYPNSVQVLPVSAATAQRPGSTAYYQLYYRNAAASFCNPATTNYSNGAIVQWL